MNPIDFNRTPPQIIAPSNGNKLTYRKTLTINSDFPVLPPTYVKLVETVFHRELQEHELRMLGAILEHFGEKI